MPGSDGAAQSRSRTELSEGLAAQHLRLAAVATAASNVLAVGAAGVPGGMRRTGAWSVADYAAIKQVHQCGSSAAGPRIYTATCKRSGTLVALKVLASHFEPEQAKHLTVE
jgi:hypothetical protein